MFESLNKMVGAAKGRLVEASARTFLNGKIQNFGRVTRLSIDPGARSASLTIELKGETSPITVEILNYDLSTSAGQTHVCLRQIQASREWLTTALTQYLVGRPLLVPPAVAPFLA